MMTVCRLWVRWPHTHCHTRNTHSALVLQSSMCTPKYLTQETLMHKCSLFSHAVENIVHHHTNIVTVRTHPHTDFLLRFLPPPFQWVVRLLADSVPDAAVVWLRLICHCLVRGRIDSLLISSSCGTQQWTGWVWMVPGLEELLYLPNNESRPTHRNQCHH